MTACGRSAPAPAASGRSVGTPGTSASSGRAPTTASVSIGTSGGTSPAGPRQTPSRSGCVPRSARGGSGSRRTRRRSRAAWHHARDVRGPLPRAIPTTQGARPGTVGVRGPDPVRGRQRHVFDDGQRFGAQPVGAITEDDVEAFMQALKARGRVASTRGTTTCSTSATCSAGPLRRGISSGPRSRPSRTFGRRNQRSVNGA